MKHLVFILFFYSLSTYGQSAEQCSQIEHTEDRLACFDHQFPNTSEVSNRHDSIEQQESQTAETANRSTEDQAITEESVGNDAKGFSLKNLFGRKAKHSFTSKIRELRSGNAQKMVFLLENDEVWLQDSPRTLPFHRGDTVTVKSALLGGYIMRSEGGTSTRVQRIR